MRWHLSWALAVHFQLALHDAGILWGQQGGLAAIRCFLTPPSPRGREAGKKAKRTQLENQQQVLYGLGTGLTCTQNPCEQRAVRSKTTVHTDLGQTSLMSLAVSLSESQTPDVARSLQDLKNQR